MKRYLFSIFLSIYLIGCVTIKNVVLEKRITEEIVTEGYGYGNKPREKLREEALLYAFKKAGRLVVGTFISSRSDVKMFNLIDNSITSRTSAYIEKYDILDERQEKDQYIVKVKAWVNVARLYDDLGIRGITTNVEDEANLPNGIIITNAKLTDREYTGIGLNNTGKEINEPRMILTLFDKDGNVLFTGSDASLNYQNYCSFWDNYIRKQEHFTFKFYLDEINNVETIKVIFEEPAFSVFKRNYIKNYNVYFVNNLK